MKGQWEVENHGIAPDVEVELDPKLVREGHDPQLERAVEVVLDLLKKHPLPTYPVAALPELSRHAAHAGAVGVAMNTLCSRSGAGAVREPPLRVYSVLTFVCALIFSPAPGMGRLSGFRHLDKRRRQPARVAGAVL